MSQAFLILLRFFFWGGGRILSSVHVKYPLFLTDFNETWFFFSRQTFPKNTKISNFMKIRSLAAKLFLCGRTNRRTDMTKLIVAFHNFENARKTVKGCIIYFRNFCFKQTMVLTILTTIVPESMTRTLSESIIVFRRWAIVRTVRSWNFLRIVSCTKVSVLATLKRIAVCYIQALNTRKTKTKYDFIRVWDVMSHRMAEKCICSWYLRFSQFWVLRLHSSWV